MLRIFTTTIIYFLLFCLNACDISNFKLNEIRYFKQNVGISGCVWHVMFHCCTELMCAEVAVVQASRRSPPWVFCPLAGEFKNNENLDVVAPHMFRPQMNILSSTFMYSKIKRAPVWGFGWVWQEPNCDDWIRDSGEQFQKCSKEEWSQAKADWCKRETIKTIFPESCGLILPRNKNGSGMFEDLSNMSDMLMWPPHYPDLSLRLCGRCWTNKSDSERNQTWCQIPEETCRGLVRSSPQ